VLCLSLLPSFCSECSIALFISVSPPLLHVPLCFCFPAIGVCSILEGGGYILIPPLLWSVLAGLGVYKEDLGLNRRIGPPEEYPPPPPSSRADEPRFLEPSLEIGKPTADPGGFVRGPAVNLPTVCTNGGVRNLSPNMLSRPRTATGRGSPKYRATGGDSS